MTLQQVRAFLTTLDRSSFSEAALDLGVNQSSVSYAVSQLEKELGVRLLERGRFGAAPTEAGSRIAEHLRKMLRLEEAARQEASVSGGELNGTLHVATFTTVETVVLPRLLMGLRERYPGLSVRPMPADRVETIEAYEQLLLDGHADIGFVMDSFTLDAADRRSNLLQWRLIDDPYVVVRNDEDRSPLDATALADATVVVAGPGPGCPVRIQEFLERYAGKGEPDIWVSEFDSVFRMVRAGVGVGVAPALACRELPEGLHTSGFVQPFARQVLIALDPSNLKIPAVRAFLAVLRELYPNSDVPPLSAPTRAGAPASVVP